MDFFTGTILAWPLSWAPEGWHLCDGSLIQISQNQALCALLGTTYGGDGRTTFGLPNLQGRFILGAGNGQGLTPRILAQTGGAETATLSQTNLPQHTHGATFTATTGATGSISGTLQASSANGNTSSATGNYIANAYYPGDSGLSISATPCNTFVDPKNAGPLTAIAGLDLKGGAGITGGTVTVGLTGENQPVAIMSPFLTLNFIICLNGMYPTRE